MRTEQPNAAIERQFRCNGFVYAMPVSSAKSSSSAGVAGDPSAFARRHLGAKIRAETAKSLFFQLQITSSCLRRISRDPGADIMAANAKKATASTKTNRPVTLKHLAATMAEEHQMTKRAGEALLGDLVGLITKHLKKGERVRISGFGILQVRKRAARMGRNPATGEAIKIKASKKVAFRASKELKLAV